MITMTAPAPLPRTTPSSAVTGSHVPVPVDAAAGVASRAGSGGHFATAVVK